MSQHEGSNTRSDLPETPKETEERKARPALRSLAPKPPPRSKPLAIRERRDPSVGPSRAAGYGSTRGKTDNRCGVCFSRHCRLVSHQLRSEKNNSTQHGSNIQHGKTSDNDTYSSSYAIDIASCYTISSPAASSLGLLRNLPIPSDLDKVEMQQLFYHWFIDQAPRHFTVPRPRELASDLLHSPFLAPALCDPVLCLSIMTISAGCRKDMKSTTNNVLALTLLGRAMEMLRECVTANRNSVPDTTIVAAIYIWGANIYIADAKSLRQYGSSVRALVDARQGLTSLGMSGAIANLFKWVDIMNSLRLGQPCQYPDNRDLVVPRPATRKYGSFWNQKDIKIKDPAVVIACRECCLCLELLVDNESETISPATYWYLYQRTAQLYQESSALRSRYHDTGTMEECIIIAIDIVKLFAFNGGQRQPGRRSLETQADKLLAAVKVTGGSGFWQYDIELLLWIMIIISLAEPQNENRPWCVRILKGALEARFGPRSSWTVEWSQELHGVLIAFGWPPVEPFDRYQEICESSCS